MIDKDRVVELSMSKGLSVADITEIVFDYVDDTGKDLSIEKFNEFAMHGLLVNMFNVSLKHFKDKYELVDVYKGDKLIKTF